MYILNIESSDDTPKIQLDKSAGIFEISGRSLPEDAVGFYEPVIEWINAYANDPHPSTDFAFKLDYFNTASSKLILDILKLLAKIKGMRILWYSQEDDEEVASAGEEFSEQVDAPFIFKTY
ncbi:MAG TPA: DUF1987 domain-containing protein [Ohtaekwangia sp.]